MSTRGRSLGAPYLKESEARVENPGRGNEKVTIYNEARGYAISYDWVHMVFAVEGSREDVKDPNGPARDYFDLLKQIRSLDGFGRLINVAVETWDVAEEEDGAPTNISEFEERYFGDKKIQLSTEKSDLALTVESRKSNRERHVVFGPYYGESDIQNHKIQVLSSTDLSRYYDLEGCLFRVKISINEVHEDFGFGDFNFLLEESQNLISACLKQ